ncbi:Outer membrane protein TolC [Parelusimicrobium proximum]|uniref:TolC family protein n=1 Tax=Parelusimicrobium proximum TaxID=3228953 RepID=UPI003D17CAEE
MTRKRKNRFLAMAAAASLAAFALPVCAQNYLITYTPAIGERMPIESAIRIAIENNSELLRIKENILVAQEQVKQSTFLRFPQVSLLATATAHNLDYPTILPEDFAMRYISPGGNSFYGAGVIASQYLYSGGRISGAIDISRSQLKEEQSKYETAKNNLILDVKLAFINLQYASEKKLAADSALKKAKDYYKKASLSAWDKITADVIVEKMRSSATEADKEEKAAHLRMLRALNRELNNPVSIAGTFAPLKEEKYDYDNLHLWAMELRPEMKTAIYEHVVNDISANLSLAKQYPDVVVSASFDKLGEKDLDQSNSQVSLSVRLPLSYSYASQSKQKKAKQKNSYLKRVNIEDMIGQDVARNYNNFMFWQEEVLVRKEAFDKLDKAFNSVKGVYNISALNALDAYKEAQFSYLNAVKENISAKAGLEWAVGRDL